MTIRHNAHNRVVVVTGAASTEGRALASQFAEQGAQLILIDEDLGRLQKLTTLLRAAYPKEIMDRITKVVVDLQDQEQSDLAIEAIRQMYGEIDTFINIRRNAA